MITKEELNRKGLYASGVREGLEMAVRLCDEYRGSTRGDITHGESTARFLASAIRALITPDAKDGGE